MKGTTRASAQADKYVVLNGNAVAPFEPKQCWNDLFATVREAVQAIKHKKSRDFVDEEEECMLHCAEWMADHKTDSFKKMQYSLVQLVDLLRPRDKDGSIFQFTLGSRAAAVSTPASFARTNSVVCTNYAINDNTAPLTCSLLDEM